MARIMKRLGVELIWFVGACLVGAIIWVLIAGSYEAASDAHHDHLNDVETGTVIEFVDEELELLQKRIAEKLGFRLVDHRMELYGVALDRNR